MNRRLAGSDLTRVMLERGDEKVWCAVSKDNDEQATANFESADYDFLKHIISVNNSKFICKDGALWRYAVPIKIKEIKPHEVGF